MDQQDSKMDTENPPEISPDPQLSGKDDSKKDTNHTEVPTDPQLSGKDDSKKDTNPPEVSPNPQLSEKDDSKKDTDPPEVSPNPQLSGKDDSKKDTDIPEGSSKPESSNKNTPRSLKAKSKIVKKSLAGKLKAKKNKKSQQIRGKKVNRKNKKVADNAESSHNADEIQIQKNETNDEPKEKSQEAGKNKVKESRNRSSNDKSPMEKSHQAQKNKEKINMLDKTEQKQKNREKHRERNKGSRSRKNKDERNGMEKSQSKDKKSERLGGIIFMCNAKTKTDCFRYRVMGVSAGKKDVVLQVKPGLKLFLYDFDLKLLYGIYKASSSGGMKLEPRAFSGKFPAQVRFNIASDCFPLPESIFKKAIKDNYNEKNKFKTELTIRQVRKLTRLFRPVGVHSAVQPMHSPPRALIREREAPDVVRGSWPHSHRERAAGHQFDQREEVPRDLFLSETSYRAYGLPRDRRNVATTSHVNPILEPYEGDYEHLRLDASYRSNVPALVERRRIDPHVERCRIDPHVERRRIDPRVERHRIDPLYLNDSEHQNYFHGAVSDHIKDPYYSYRYGASPRDAYLTPSSREDIITSSSYLVGGRPLVGTDNLQRRETVQDRHYSIYSAADALSDYNRMQPYHGGRLEASPVPVSSRYSFAGPPFYRR